MQQSTESQIPTPADDDVTVEVTENGDLVTRLTLLEDYTYRGDDLSDLSLWEYVTHVQKIKRPRPRRQKRGISVASKNSEVSDTNSTSSHDAMDVDPNERDSILFSQTASRPVFPLQSGHPQSHTHVLQIVHPLQRWVPVPVGPTIPRRDRESDLTDHSRLMLIFFKPWYTQLDLLTTHTSWLDAFTEWTSTARPEDLRRIRNMQLLHECRDSRDDHNAQRRARARNSNINLAPTFPQFEGSGTSIDDTQSLDALAQADTLESLLRMDAQRSRYLNNASEDVQDGVAALLESGILDTGGTALAESYRRVYGHDPLSTQSLLLTSLANPEDKTTEQYMRQVYKLRKKEWKEAASTAEQRAVLNESQSQDTMSDPVTSQTAAISVLSAAPTAQFTATIVGPHTPEEAEARWQREITRFVGGILWRYPLNSDQNEAFQNVVEQVRKTTRNVPVEPLRMILAGAAGTGKSTVISAVTALFTLLNRAYNIRVCAYTGVAANNIDGTVKGQNKIFGKLLWYSLRTCVKLRQTMRQVGTDANDFVDLLNRVRIGATTSSDYEKLNSRVLRNLPRHERPDGFSTPILVSNNQTKDEINITAARAFAEVTNRELHWYHSIKAEHESGLPVGTRDLNRGKPAKTRTRELGSSVGKYPYGSGYWI
ncbi:hypothetical protein DFP72DRAFT_863845 [Ephemerocybe angulata]|uniref:Uncharacterized protein n=1 Tax=Ephemerocybe angulata TaxID=980116 RepID=A0A8H6LRE4_9AGAR|nr:hypothetical protein DFP72DRAFT_863845 [Tulosesus angulatus]